MIETLNTLDTNLFLFLNGVYNDYFNEFMWIVTRSATWAIIIVALLYVIFKKDWRQGIAIVVGIALVICLADQLSSGLIKPLVERWRPTHDPLIQNLVHVVNGYRGGNYGFVSSHAANSFGVALFLTLIFKRRLFTFVIFAWALILSYSRIYLGVHYPGDIICGALIGLGSGYLVYWVYKWAVLHFSPLSRVTLDAFSKKQCEVVVGCIILTFTVIAIVSIFLC